MSWTVESLRAFEESVREAYLTGEVRGALHLSRGNEAQLIEVFKDVRPADWVFSTYRSHYHALLHGLGEEYVRAKIMAGRSINIFGPLFFSSSIVGGCLPIAVGTALAIKRKRKENHVWCFVGDMAASGGMFLDCVKYADGWELPITFVIEDNGYSTNTPTSETWRNASFNFASRKVRGYSYEREFPHSGYKL